MGFLIFAFRKLQLKLDINRKTYEQMTLSMEKQRITNQIGQVQQGMSDAQNMISIFSNSTLANGQQQLMSYYYNQDGTPKNENAQFAYMQQYQQLVSDTTLKTNMMNSAFEGAQKAQLQQLQMKDQQISTRLASLESQLTEENADLSNVEKAETKAAESEAPKFGLG